MKRIVLVVIALFALPGLIYAHVYLSECSPEEDAVLKEAPTKVTITFVGSVEPAFSKIEVFNPEGKKISKKTEFLDSDTIMEAELEGDLGPGEYTVKWKCMSLDGHKQTGKYNFTIT